MNLTKKKYRTPEEMDQILDAYDIMKGQGYRSAYILDILEVSKQLISYYRKKREKTL